MKSAHEIKEEVLAICDPNQAYLKLSELTVKENLPLDEWEKILEAYTEKYDTDEDHMAFYPDGERVITLDVYWSFEKEETKRGPIF